MSEVPRDAAGDGEIDVRRSPSALAALVLDEEAGAACGAGDS